MRLGVGEGAHDLSAFVVGHFVFSKGRIVDKHPPSELIGDSKDDERPPHQAEDHVGGDTERLEAGQFVGSAQVVDFGKREHGDAEDCAVVRALSGIFLMVGEQVTVRVALHF